MAGKGTRAFMGFIAVLFIVTSSATTILVIYQIVQDNRSSKVAQSSNQSASNQPKESKVNNSKQLQGTKLADFTPMASIPQLQELDLTPGTGDTVKPGATVTVDYTGAVASTGVIFQSSKDSGQPVSFPLSGVIAGWSQGIPGMKVGGTRRLLIPAALAYGSNPPAGSGIPANADLVFDVTLHSISKQ